jgi:hypothetical protein
MEYSTSICRKCGRGSADGVELFAIPAENPGRASHFFCREHFKERGYELPEDEVLAEDELDPVEQGFDPTHEFDFPDEDDEEKSPA